MPCHAMHPIQDLFLESFSYELQLDMHSYLHKNFILAKSGCYNREGLGFYLLQSIHSPGGCKLCSSKHNLGGSGHIPTEYNIQIWRSHVCPHR
jgi:hypothetical protein